MNDSSFPFPENLKYMNFVSKRARLEDAVAERKKAELSYMEFEKARLDEIDRLALSNSDENKKQIFILIFSPPSIRSLKIEYEVLSENCRTHHHIISDSINLDERIWKLVNVGQWDMLKNLHRPTLVELCPCKFRPKLDLLWS